MRIFSLLALAFTLALGTVSMDAEAAKRLGGGKSSGMQRQSAQDSAKPTPDAPTASPNAAAAGATGAAAAAGNKRSWMGPVAGIAAGLGLAALASHLGFGEELASMLMLGLLAMAVMVVVGMVMRKRALARMGSAAGGVNAGQPMQYAGMGSPMQAPSRPAFEVSMPGGTGSGGGSTAGNGGRNIPADFDVAGFEQNAKTQFVRLQKANDTGNADEVRALTTPELFAELQADLAQAAANPGANEVRDLHAQVVEVAQETTQYVVSVRFTGNMFDAVQQSTDAFDELWHLSKPRFGSGGWLLSGIEQTR